MSPGHGKALIGAYLITAKGRIRDAVLLGLTVTVTHTGSVMLIGVSLLLFSKEVKTEEFTPILTLVSGLLIASLFYDHTGALNLAVKSITVQKVSGILLVLAGSYIALRSPA